ncbi:MAG: hypothetical protein ICV51_09995 [Flavisolibacter sp.]|nr:hypothetical protein [Flavisolibacter sp.]
MTRINHYEANLEIRYVYSQLEERLRELEAFLSHVHGFVTNAEEKIGPDLEIYSQDFFDYFYAGSYGETFRSSFIVTITSICEGHIKDFVSAWKTILQINLADLKWNNSILDLLKEADRAYFKMGMDFTRKEIIDFRGLLAVRNAVVHSSGKTDYVAKYVPLIKQLSKAYPSLELTTDGFIITSEQFCKDAMIICQQFFFYISKLAVRKFPEYRAHRPIEEDF